nr:hypothetical protein [Tanacetum cinerariifolium]
MSDLSRPPGFKHVKRSSSSTSKCSTNFARHQKKDIKDISLIHELNKIIKVETSLGYWNNAIGDCYMINIYGPQETSAKSSLWNRITEFMHQHDGKFILFGDMNTVRHENERSGTKLSKLDYFHIYEGISKDIPDIKVMAIDCMLSDHIHIVLHAMKLDFGPSPFKFYNSWLYMDGFDDLIKSTWSILEAPNDGRILRSHEKLRCLKTVIKQWHSNTRNNDHTLKQVALSNIKDIGKKIDDAHIKRDIEGDENSKFFHGMINNKRRSQAITGIFHDGVWISDLLLIKVAFLNYYKENFQAHDSQVVFSLTIHYTSLTSLDRDSLETHISLYEIKTAVWD